MNQIQLDERLTEIFSTNFGAVYQCDLEQLFILSFSGKKIKYKYPCLQRLKKVIDKVDLVKLTDARHSGLEIIFLCGAEDCFVLDLREIIGLQDLLKGTFTMLQLNSMIKDCLQRTVI